MSLKTLLSACVFLAANAQWQEFKPGNGTLCAKGGEYSYYAKKGTINKLVVFLQGGGACWSALTCDAGSCSESIPRKQLKDLDNIEGLLSTGKGSPVDGWHQLYLPYCSCDGHSGNKTVTYGLGKFHHFGRINADAALQWAYENVPNPDVTFTTGCSAGSVGSYIWAPHVMDHYKTATNYHVGDSYIPLFGKTGWEDGCAKWDMPNAFLPVIRDQSTFLPWTNTTVPSIMANTVNYFPHAKFASFTSNADKVQTSFYKLEGAGAGPWKTAMRSTLSYMHSLAKYGNFGTYIKAGNTHCQSPEKSFFTDTSGGVKLVDWYTGLITGARTWNNAVDCTPNC